MAGKTTFQDQLLETILGDVVTINHTVEEIRAALPSLKQEFESVAAGAGEKLASAVENAAKEAETAARLAAADAMQKAGAAQVKALVDAVGLAVDDLRLTADKANGRLRSAVAKVSIWRQVGFSVGGALLASLLVCVLFWSVGAAPARPTRAAAESLSDTDKLALARGRVFEKIWPQLTEAERAHITALAAGKAQ